MRNYQHVDEYLNELKGDIYPQPEDEEHTELAEKFINEYISKLECKSVLDVGCGTGFVQPMIENLGMKYHGVCLGEDYKQARKLKRSVFRCDFSFLPYSTERFDLIFSRHSLEHSPIPLITLMEWHRVSIKWLALVMPNPDYWDWMGRNHYFLGNMKQIRWILRRAGWKIERHDVSDKELWFLCEKQPRISYEGYERSPLSNEVYTQERDEIW